MSAAPRPFIVYGFRCTHDAIAAETVLRGAGVAVVTVPSPQELGDLCGIALRVAPEDSERVERLLLSAHAVWRGRAEILDR